MTVIKRTSLGRNVSLLIWNSVKIMLRLFFVLINVPLFVNISFMDHVCGFYIKLSLFLISQFFKILQFLRFNSNETYFFISIKN